MSSILILGAAYGSLLATRLALAGHHVCLVCTEPTARLINRDGTFVRFPVKDLPGLVEVHSRSLPAAVVAGTPLDVEPSQFDMCILAMQEPQYGDAQVRRLMERIAKTRTPALAVMNMPPLAYLSRMPAVDAGALRDVYSAPEVWDLFDPGLITLASPDPQAFRPAGEGKNVLQVGLPTNFKTAAFGTPSLDALLRRLQADIEASLYDHQGQRLQLPVKLKVHDSPYVPLAKWPMLMTGNYRCVRPGGPVSIKDAVHAHQDASREIYQWVASVCCRIGASPDELVPFEKYAEAALKLEKPSSVARALDGGAMQIERVDLLVQAIAAQLGMFHPLLDTVVVRINSAIAVSSNGAERLRSGTR